MCLYNVIKRNRCIQINDLTTPLLAKESNIGERNKKRHQCESIGVPLPLLLAPRHEFQKGAGTVGWQAHSFRGIVQARIPLTTLDAKGVGATPCSIFVLFEKQNALTRLRKDVATRAPSRTTADDDGVQIVGD